MSAKQQYFNVFGVSVFGSEQVAQHFPAVVASSYVKGLSMTAAMGTLIAQIVGQTEATQKFMTFGGRLEVFPLSVGGQQPGTDQLVRRLIKAGQTEILIAAERQPTVTAYQMQEFHVPAIEEHLNHHL